LSETLAKICYANTTNRLMARRISARSPIATDALAVECQSGD